MGNGLKQGASLNLGCVRRVHLFRIAPIGFFRGQCCLLSFSLQPEMAWATAKVKLPGSWRERRFPVW